MGGTGIRHTFWVLFRAVVFCLVLIATGLPAPAEETVKNPETYVHVGPGDWDTLDPAVAYDISSDTVIANIYEPLIDFDGVHVDRYVPLLATDVPSLKNGLLSRDGRVYTFPIRQGVRFHDGTLMRPQDVAYSLRRFLLIGAPVSALLLEPFLGIYHVQDEEGKLAFSFADLERVIRVHGDSVVLTLPAPFGPFLSVLAGFSFVVSEQWARANGDWDGTAATLPRHANAKKESTAFFARANGTGPFKLEQWDRAGRQLVLARNDAYWRIPPRLARVVLRAVPETTTRVLMFKSGDADSIVLGRRDLPLVEGAPGVRVIDNLPLTTRLSSVLWFVMDIDTQGNPNTVSGRLDGNGIPGDFFTDVHVRRAFGYAFDYETFIASAYRGKAVPARGMFPRGMLGYRLGQDYFTLDRGKAIAEFKAAWGGAIWERGFRLTILHITGVAESEVAILLLKEGIESLNPRFKIDTRSLLYSSFIEELHAHRAPAFWSGYEADYPDPHNAAFAMLHSGSMRIQRYQTPGEVDSLIIDALREADPRKREALYFEINRKYFELAPSITTVSPVGFRAQRSWVRGWYFNPARFFRYYSIWKS